MSHLPGVPPVLLLAAFATAALLPAFRLAGAEASDSDVVGRYVELFGAEEKSVLATATTRDDIQFAGVLLQKATALKDDPKLCGYIYLRAYTLAMKDPDGYATALAALDAWATADPVFRERSAVKYTEWARVAVVKGRPAERATAANRLVPALTAEADALAADRKFADAIKTYREALGLAQTARLPEVEEINNRIKSVTSKQQLIDKLTRLQSRADGGDQASGREALEVALLELDDPELAAKYARFAPDAEYRSMLQKAASQAAAMKLSDDDVLTLAKWYRQIAASASVAGKTTALVRAGGLAQRFIDNHPKQDANRLLAVQERDKAFELLAAAGMTGADRLVIWNTTGGPANDRGAKTINILLMYRGAPVWKRLNVPLDWAAGKETSLTVTLPKMAFDTVRVEVIQWRGLGGGLGEIQVFRGNDNMALNAQANASAAYDKRFAPSQLTDGITSSHDAAKGYWLLPNSVAGWAEVVLIGRR